MHNQLSRKDIARSPQKIDRESFERLFNLTKAQPWLESRQDRLFDLIEMCLSTADQIIICNLLYRFTYLSGLEIQAVIKSIAGRVCAGWTLKPSSTIVVARNNSHFSDSSQSLLWMLKPEFAVYGNDWNTTNFVAKMSDAVDRSKDGDTIVLIDEFVGTGISLSSVRTHNQ